MRGGDIAGLLIRAGPPSAGLESGRSVPWHLRPLLSVQNRAGQGRPLPGGDGAAAAPAGSCLDSGAGGLAPCWKALLSGSPNFDSLYEQLVQPRREILGHPVRWQRMPCCWMPFTPTRCALCRWSGSPFSPPGSWPYSEACKADGRRRCGWSRCRCWLPTTESSSTPRANTPPPSRCCGTPTARHRTPATPT